MRIVKARRIRLDALARSPYSPRVLKLRMAPAGRVAMCAVAVTLLLPTLSLARPSKSRSRSWVDDVQVVSITPGRSVDVVIAGSQPMTIAEGETARGITVVKVSQRSAVLRMGGITKTLSLSTARGSADQTGSVTLRAGPGGHYFTNATINGTSLPFMVDTGATSVAISRAQAQRIGLNYQRGTPALSHTANGVAMGWRLSLRTIKVGGLTVHNVDAMVLDTDLSMGLLGMSFLSRFDMHRTGSTLELRRRH